MYVCRKMKLCSYLLTKGFQYKKIRQDRYNPSRKVWLFESSPELYIAIDEYYSFNKADNK